MSALQERLVQKINFLSDRHVKALETLVYHDQRQAHLDPFD